MNRKVERVTADLRETITILNRLLASVEHPGGKVPVLEELYRRTSLQSVPDGYPARTLPETSVSGGGGHSSVEGSALLRNGWEVRLPRCEKHNCECYGTPTCHACHCPVPKSSGRPPPVDPLRGLGVRLFDDLARLAALATAIDHRRDVILKAGEDERGRQSSVQRCEACERTVPGTPADRLRSGFCDACRKRWARTDQGSGRMDRHTFVRMVREERAA